MVGQYVFSYWVDIQNGVPACDQVIEFTGSTQFSAVVQGCQLCPGSMAFTPGSFVDVTDNTVDPDHCAPGFVTGLGVDYGDQLTDPTQYGDFAGILGLMGSNTLAASGIDLTVQGGTTAAELEAKYADLGLDFTHAGFVDAGPTTLAGTAGLSAISNPPPLAPQEQSNFLAAWEIFNNPAVNPYGGSGMQGEYGGQAVFILTLGAGGAADGVSFTFTTTVTP